MEFRYHPEIEGLKVNEDGSEILLNDKPIAIRQRKTGKHPFRYIPYRQKSIGVAKIVLECWKGLAPELGLTARHKDGDYTNYHYTNLEWGKNGGNSSIQLKLTPELEREIIKKTKEGLTIIEISKLLGVSNRTVGRVRERNKNKQNTE